MGDETFSGRTKQPHKNYPPLLNSSSPLLQWGHVRHRLPPPRQPARNRPRALGGVNLDTTLAIIVNSPLK